MFRLLDENMLVVYVIDNVYVPVLGVDLEDDGFDGGVAMYEYAFCILVSTILIVFCRDFLPSRARGMMT